MKSLRGIKAIVGSFFRKRGDLGAQASMASFFTTTRALRLPEIRKPRITVTGIIILETVILLLLSIVTMVMDGLNLFIRKQMPCMISLPSANG